MKGLILSGGKGTRLRPITYTSAKQLVPVANKPVLFYTIEDLVNAGITDIGIVVGDTRAEIRQAVGDGGRWGANVTYIEQPEPLGLAHAVIVAEDYLGDSPFVMYLGDNMLEDRIAPFVEEYRQGKWDCQVLLKRVPTRSKFGVAELAEDGKGRAPGRKAHRVRQRPGARGHLYVQQSHLRGRTRYQTFVAQRIRDH